MLRGIYYTKHNKIILINLSLGAVVMASCNSSLCPSTAAAAVVNSSFDSFRSCPVVFTTFSELSKQIDRIQQWLTSYQKQTEFNSKNFLLKNTEYNAKNYVY